MHLNLICAKGFNFQSVIQTSVTAIPKQVLTVQDLIIKYLLSLNLGFSCPRSYLIFTQKLISRGIFQILL